MNKFIKSWLDYREYLYYYKIILVVLLGAIIERKIEYDFFGYLIRSIIEFIGIKYWVFKNDWNNKKSLKREIIFYILLKICLFIIRPVILKLGTVYKNLSIHKNIKRLNLKNIKEVLNFLKTDGTNRITLWGNIFYMLYEFLTTSFLAYPFFRYIIFTPNNK